MLPRVFLDNPGVRLIARNLPDKLKTRLQKPYHRYLSYEATRAHSSVPIKYDVDEKAPQHIVLVVIDALRPDFESILDQKKLYSTTSAIAPGTWTFPSVTSMHVGQYPHVHRANVTASAEGEGVQIPNQTDLRPTLPMELEAAGYDTLAVTGFLTPHLAISGWYNTHKVYHHAPAEQVFARYDRWRSDRNKTFSYLHLGDLHEPLDPPDEFSELKEGESIDLLTECQYFSDFSRPGAKEYRKKRMDLYKATADYVQQTLNRFITSIDDDTLVIVTGDHGEAHWEQHKLASLFTDSRSSQGAGHGGTPFDMVSRVPLALYDPTDTLINAEILSRGGWASLIDIPESICTAIGISPDFDGKAWSDPLPSDRSVISESSTYGPERKAVYCKRNKIIRSEYDDVTLSGNINIQKNEEYLEHTPNYKNTLLDELPSDWSTDSSGHLDAFAEDQLRALGYK